MDSLKLRWPAPACNSVPSEAAQPAGKAPLTVAKERPLLRQRDCVPTYVAGGGRIVPFNPTTTPEAVYLYKHCLVGAAPPFSKQSGKLYREIAAIESPVQVDALMMLCVTYLQRAKTEGKALHHTSRAVESAELAYSIAPQHRFTRKLLFEALFARLQLSLNEYQPLPVKSGKTSALVYDDYTRCITLFCGNVENGEIRFPELTAIEKILTSRPRSAEHESIWLRIRETLAKRTKNGGENLRTSEHLGRILRLLEERPT